MESVEEMCDSVALINNSKKFWTEKFFEVREQFKQNLYNIVLSEVNSEQLDVLKQIQFPDVTDKHGLISFDLSYNEDQNLLK
jgi:ABC-2 type transport system ATP-binding protein